MLGVVVDGAGAVDDSPGRRRSTPIAGAGSGAGVAVGFGDGNADAGTSV